MADIVAFITARLDEDEAVARAAVLKSENGDQWQLAGLVEREDYLFHSIATAPPIVTEIAGSGFDGTGGIHAEVFARHMIRHDPARVLAEVAAKRAIIGDDSDGCALFSVHERGLWQREVTEFADTVLRLLAAPYAAHPDYDQSWAVE